jgi:hypothetical protein
VKPLTTAVVSKEADETEAVFSSIVLTNEHSKSKQRERDPSAGSGDRAQKGKLNKQHKLEKQNKQ